MDEICLYEMFIVWYIVIKKYKFHVTLKTTNIMYFNLNKKYINTKINGLYL